MGELSKKVAEDEHLSQQEVAKEKMMQLEEAMSVQQQQHLSCWMYLKSMEVKLGIRDAELNDILAKCSHYEKKLDENEKEMSKLRVEKEDYSVEMEEKVKVISMREKELDEMRTQWDMKMEEQLEVMKSLNADNITLKDQLLELRIVVESTRAELQEERLSNDTKNSTIEELNEKVSRITEEKMRMKSEYDKSIKDLELCTNLAQEVAKEKMLQLEEAMSVQQQQHLSCRMSLKSMEVKLSAREKELDEFKAMCRQNEYELEDRENEIVRLRKEREVNEVEMEEKRVL